MWEIKIESLTRPTEWPLFPSVHVAPFLEPDPGQSSALLHVFSSGSIFFSFRRFIQTPNFKFIKTVTDHLRDGKILWVQSARVSQTIIHCRMIPISKHPANRPPPQGCWLPVTVFFSGRLLENYNSNLCGLASGKFLVNPTKESTHNN